MNSVVQHPVSFCKETDCLTTIDAWSLKLEGLKARRRRTALALHEGWIFISGTITATGTAQDRKSALHLLCTDGVH